MEPAVSASIVVLIKAISPTILNSMAKSARLASDKIKLKLESTFKEHVRATFEKCNSVQTIFTNEQRVPLRSIYTNLYIQRSSKIRDDDIINKIDKIGNIVISGTGGAGKTMLMKYLAVHCIEYPIGKIPIFIELRNLSNHIPAHFLQTILDYCSPGHDDTSLTIFRQGLRDGIFIIFFDGLDEVPSENREQIFNSIKRMAREFKKCHIISSTRPEIDTREWGELETYRLMGLTENQTRNLINKISFPDELKAEFLDLIDAEFFEKYSSFLSVPLLCSLMLFSYHEFQSVPSRITVFYEQAFETLMRRHDRAKEGYFKRHFESGLSSDRFRAIFSAFCYRTLAKQEVSFSDDKFRHHLSRAAEITEVDVNVDYYASDLVSCVCVIMRDGLNLHFIHRSFQEYFAALFLLRYKGADVFSLYSSLFGALNVNDVAVMAADIDIQAFEREWAFPACTKIINELNKVPKHKRPLKLLELCWFTLSISTDSATFNTFSWQPGNFYHEALIQLSKVYGDEGNIGPFSKGEIAGDSSAEIYIKEQFPKLSFNEVFDIDEDNDEFQELEFRVEMDKIDWIKDTSMYTDLEKKVVRIYNLHRALKARIDRRGSIDILR